MRVKCYKGVVDSVISGVQKGGRVGTRVYFHPRSSVDIAICITKRGLPHAHFLIILKPCSKLLRPEEYDRFVSTELPNKDADPYMYGLVFKHMMHGSCGELNDENVCMRDTSCKNKYPKLFSDHSVHGKGSYPTYHRRDDGRSTMVRGKLLDNRWVVPYSPRLLAKFNCHFNMEICCDIRIVKYLYKYVHKGHDNVSFRISSEHSSQNVNEIDNFRNARWVSLPEAIWRIYGFPLNGIYTAVLQLRVHLPDYQTIRFEDDANLEELMRDEKSKRSMLTEFFRMNDTDQNVTHS
ncbi:hypothetical protein LIER_18563 [Lithospermum erythrorhizon]|uniref:Helitron helicase-like domain-containing protein n=1 Tax=Lithospermum erythrorhizon TaxID=34254 RepID=A0AAV3QJU9_LITER